MAGSIASEDLVSANPRFRRPMAAGAVDGGPIRSAGLGGFLHTPELKTLLGDCFFDRPAGKIVRRGAVRADHARCLPGTVLGRQLAAGGVAGERAQIAAGLRLEHENVHHANILSAATTRRRVGWPAPRGAGWAKNPSLGPRYYLRLNCWRCGGRPTGAARSSLWRKISLPFSRS